MLLLIDNYDSFTHNLARYFKELGQDVVVVRNDEISCLEIAELHPNYLVLSPGPCTPDSAGITLKAIKHFAGLVPILGVCLGHQAIGQVFGAKVIKAPQIKHGKTSQIYHSHSTLFTDVALPFNATRYHSLILETDSVPKDFRITAWCHQSDNIENNDLSLQPQQKQVMAIEHNTLPIFGVQFHPESLLTEFGHCILNNFLNSYNNADTEKW
ncbi:aminodeoxychorismate/anthranilate synthase component II [uncultured Paraglaciecola sp.]|uniref:anthranilate synthase component II n=1 Tax=uncultured Paraglaciecola sp. TaxID=1765024 RepID=UPI002603798D|nr:aminodeoxychorismate/anthranilate synthase component II [uncultured Paraglaciecola sp.]